MTEETEETEEPTAIDTAGMSDEEILLAAQFYECIQLASTQSPRTLQAANFQIGVSDIGTCQERTRRLLMGIPESESKDMLSAWLGTVVGDGLERAVAANTEGAQLGTKVSVELQGDGGYYTLDGHPDIVFPWGVVDVKKVDGLEVVRRNGPTFQQLFQRNAYTLGAHEAGLLAVPLEEAKTANIWVDGSGRTKNLWCHITPYDPDVIEQGAQWLDEVAYAIRTEQTAMKEPPRQWCQAACGHFADCRQFDMDVEGLITDSTLLTAFEIYQEGKALEKEGKRLRKEGVQVLEGVSGYTPDGFQLSWSWVNGSEFQVKRKGYSRINVSKVRTT